MSSSTMFGAGRKKGKIRLGIITWKREETIRRFPQQHLVQRRKRVKFAFLAFRFHTRGSPEVQPGKVGLAIPPSSTALHKHPLKDQFLVNYKETPTVNIMYKVALDMTYNILHVLFLDESFRFQCVIQLVVVSSRSHKEGTLYLYHISLKAHLPSWYRNFRNS